MAKRRPGKSRTPTDLSISKLIRLVNEFRLIPWERHFPGQLPVALATPKEPPLTLSVALMDDREISGDYALVVLRGPRSCRAYIEFTRTSNDVYFDPIEAYILSYTPLEELPAPVRRFLEKGGLRATPSQLVPYIRRRENGGHEQPLRAAEVRELTRALELLGQARALGEWGDRTAVESGEGVFELCAVRRNEITIEERPLPSREEMDLPDLPIQLPKYLRRPVSPSSEFALFTKFEVDATTGSTETRIGLFDVGTRKCFSEFLLRGDQRRLSMPAWCELLDPDTIDHPDDILPRRIVFSDAVTESAIREALEGFGIETALDPDHWIFVSENRVDEATETLDRSLERDTPEEMTPLAWELLRNRWKLRLGTELTKLDGKEAGGAFFRTDDLDLLNELLEIEPVAASYYDWLRCDFRAHDGADTLIESVLAEKRLTRLDRALLEAERDAIIGHFRVVSSTDDSMITIENTITEETMTVLEPRLARPSFVGQRVYLRVITVCGTALGSIAGPVSPEPADPGTSHQLWLDLLEERGEDSSGGNLRPLAPLLGALWAALIERDWAVEESDVSDDEAGARSDPDTHAAARGSGLWHANRSGEPDREPNSNSLFPSSPFDSSGLPSEDVAMIANQIRERLLGWLDEKIPDLDDRTPRVAVKTEEGRRKVIELIDTMPQPIDEPRIARALDFEAVRTRMRSVLGIEEGET